MPSPDGARRRAAASTRCWLAVAIAGSGILSCALAASLRGVLRADDGEAWPAARGWVESCPPYCSVGDARMSCSADGRWLAALEYSGRFRVWELGPRHQLEEPVIDSTAQGFTPHSFAWCGNTLLYGLFDGEIDWHALDMEFSAEEANAYLAARFRALAWDTTTREEAPGIPGGFAAAVADRRAEHVLLAGNRLLMGREAGPCADLVQVYSWPERRITLESVCACGGALSGGIGAARWLVGGCTEPDGFFLMAERETAALPDVVGEYPVPVLAFLDLSGHLKELSDPDQVFILSGKQHSTPIPAIVDEGSAVAVLQGVLGGKIGIAVYAADGLRREYPFSVSRPFPPKLAEVSPWWELVVCTPDGKHALFQEARDPYHWDEPRGAPWRVYLWDLEAETYEPIVEMNEIEYCFGWLPNSALLVGALAEGQSPDQHVHRLYDYGVLHLTRPPE